MDILDAIFNISKSSMMQEWHQLDSSSTMPEQQESTKKNDFKIKFQINLVFYWTTWYFFITFCIHMHVNVP